MRTTAIVAAFRFRRNIELARHYLQHEGYVPNMVGKSRFNRRPYLIQNLLFALFHQLGKTWKELNGRLPF